MTVMQADVREAVDLLPAFSELAPELRAALAEQGRLVEVEQDRVVPRADGEGHQCFIVRGQVAFAEFAAGEVPKPPVNKKKRITPVMQVCERVVALFEAGDTFRDAHAAAARGPRGKRDMALFTCLPVVYLEIPHEAVEALRKAHPSFAEVLHALAEEAFRRQTILQLDARDELLDFYVKQGFEYAHAIKVIQTDKCIDCDECVKACEDRHGISRIERFGPRVGLMQFTLNCRSCEDARCIDVCNFDAIGYDDAVLDPEVIVYDNCVGCTKCAKACPHEAIRMVDVAPPPEIDIVALARDEKPRTQVAPGEEKAPKKKKKPKRIANKCDHCFGYEDMACISACPTEAIIQIDPKRLFTEDDFDRAPFNLGWSQTHGRGVRALHVLFALAFLGVAVAFWEYVSRAVAPDTSPTALLGGPHTIELSPVRGFLRWMGYAGSLMMVVSALYTVRLHIPGIRRLGAARTWFDLHVVFGLAGPALSLLHTNFSVFDVVQRPLVVSLWWMVFAVVISGILGRFFYTAIPRLEAAAERRRVDLERGLHDVAEAWSSLTVSDNLLAQFLKAREKTASAGELDDLSVPRAILELIRSEGRRFFGRFGLRAKLRDISDKGLRATAYRLMNERADVERRAASYAVAKRLLSWWRAAHIAITLAMFVALAAHLAISVYATGWGF